MPICTEDGDVVMDHNLDLLLQRLRYVPDEGNFYWLQDVHRHKGRLAGRITTHGYRQISFGKSTVHAHVLVFYAENGRMPRGDIDHIDRDRLNNRIGNLREATRSQNAINASAKVTNKVGIRGVTYDDRKRLYRAIVTKDGKAYSCGRHKTKEAAAAAYSAKARELYGDFVPSVDLVTEARS